MKKIYNNLHVEINSYYFLKMQLLIRLLDKDFIQKRILMNPLDPYHFRGAWVPIVINMAWSC